MNLLDFTLIGLATWRVSSLLVTEAGPFDIFQRLRDWLRVYPVKTGDEVVCQSESAAFGMFCCIWCMSVWISALMLAVHTVAPVVVWWLAVSALAIVAQQVVHRA